MGWQWMCVGSLLVDDSGERGKRRICENYESRRACDFWCVELRGDLCDSTVAKSTQEFP